MNTRYGAENKNKSEIHRRVDEVRIFDADTRYWGAGTTGWCG